MKALAPALLALIAAQPAGADCRLALALAFDVSASVDAREYRLMMEGTAAALRDPAVRAALRADLPVALAAYVWAGRREQAIAVDWQVLDTEAQIDDFAARLEGFPRPTGDPLGSWAGRTAVGAALEAGRGLLARAPVCDRQTLDLAGDGPGNDGADGADLGGVTVNALAVAGSMPMDYDGAVDGLQAWYRRQVLQGPGAFALEAQGYEDFARAMQIKLLREVQPLLLGGL